MAGASASLHLPVLGEPGAAASRMKKSKMGKRRAIVLTLVHVLILVHVIHWLTTGSTVSPIEPSEAMEFSKRGIVNAGLIFFALALLSTLILGRWFCGWACHLVALQDLCGWLMKKAGVRPKPFRSRTLIYVPLLLGSYMFIWPAFYRLAIAPWLGTSDRLPPWGVQAHLNTSDFWGTFPGWIVAVPFLLICGFACVYFLGQKGFCTYGCPYGGFFAPLDQFAVGRIRVTDDCEQCGHCTAACTSNVRVHEEVRDFGMVVDPGCMKCLDCVSVCPNDALSFGFGKLPAKLQQSGKNQTAHGRESRSATRRYDMSLGEDWAVAALFAAVFFAFRGEYARFPLLMAAGTAMVMTFIIWKAYRALRDQNVNLHRWQLKLRGSLRLAGIGCIAVATLLIALVVQSAAVNAASLVASHHDDRVNLSRRAVFFSGADLDAQTREHAVKAVEWYERSAALSLHGLGLARAWRSMIDMRLAWFHAVLGDFEAAEEVLRKQLSNVRDSATTRLIADIGILLAAQPAKQDEAMTWYREALLDDAHWDDPAFPLMLEEFVEWASMSGQVEEAKDILDQLGMIDVTTAQP